MSQFRHWHAHKRAETLHIRVHFSILVCALSPCFSFLVSEYVQIVPQQQGTIARPQVTLAQSPMVTLRGQSHSRIIVGQPQVVKQLQTGVSSTYTPRSFISELNMRLFVWQ